MRHLILLVAVLVAGCSRQERREPAEGSHVSEAVNPSSSPEPRAMEPSRDLSALQERLQWEAQHRPTISVTAERVLDELDRVGMPLVERKQYLASSMRASYCAGGVTQDGIAVSVCEYASKGEAAQGRRYMAERFGAKTPLARREVHGETVLTVVRGPDPASGDVVARAITTFKNLKQP